MRKAGVIVGIAILLLAVAILGITRNMEKKKASGDVQTVRVAEKPVTKSTEKPVEKPVEKKPEETPKPVEKETPPKEEGAVKETPKGRAEEIAKEALPEHEGEKTEIGVIASKRLMVLEESTGSESKSLVYVLDVLTATNTRVHVFVTEKGHEMNQIGDKVKVVYRVYKGGYPLVESVETVEKAGGL